MSPNKIVFDGMLHTGKPDLSVTHNMPKIYQVGHNAVPGWTDPTGNPTSTWFDNIVNTYHPSSGWIFIDSESWPNGTQAERLSFSAHFVYIATELRARNPDFKFGFYAFPMMRDFWRAITLPGHANYTQWQIDCEDYASVYSHVDALFPSLYFFYDRFTANPWTVSQFRHYIRLNILEQKRLRDKFSPGLKIYPFVWWRHDPSGDYIDFDVWCEALRVCYRECDGMVVWGGWLEQWSAFAATDWWKEVETRMLTRRYW